MPESRLRFLIVDDFATTRRIIGKLVREIGFAPAEATDGHAALGMLRCDRYDFVIADVEMPRMDGFELAAAMRADSALRPIPVLLVSREASKEQVVQASRVGASGYIVLPLTRAGLEEKVCAILGLPPSSPRPGRPRTDHGAVR
jgi:two-component system, chemotaxis family, chemotaxis protein CheY